QRVRPDARVAFGDDETVRGAAKAVSEVLGLDDERIAFPASARAAQPSLDRRRRVRTTVERDDARIVNLLGIDQYVIGRLHDLVVAVVARQQIGYAIRAATLGQRATFGAVIRASPRALDALCGAACQRRNASVRRIDDERRAIVELPLDEPA